MNLSERLEKIVEDTKAQWSKPKEKRKYKLPRKTGVIISNLIQSKTKKARIQLLTEEEVQILVEEKKSSRDKLFTKYKKCQNKECGSKEKLTIEHIIPLVTLKLFGIKRRSSLNYDIHKRNLTVLCEKCNNKKGHSVDLKDKKIRNLLIWYIKNHDKL